MSSRSSLRARRAQGPGRRPSKGRRMSSASLTVQARNSSPSARARLTSARSTSFHSGCSARDLPVPPPAEPPRSPSSSTTSAVGSSGPRAHGAAAATTTRVRSRSPRRRRYLTASAVRLEFRRQSPPALASSPTPRLGSGRANYPRATHHGVMVNHERPRPPAAHRTRPRQRPTATPTETARACSQQQHATHPGGQEREAVEPSPLGCSLPGRHRGLTRAVRDPVPRLVLPPEPLPLPRDIGARQPVAGDAVAPERRVRHKSFNRAAS